MEAIGAVIVFHEWSKSSKKCSLILALLKSRMGTATLVMFCAMTVVTERVAGVIVAISGMHLDLVRPSS